MTANVMAGEREKCLAAGMDDYIGRPLGRAELLASLERGAAQAVRPFDIAVLDGFKADDEAQLVALLEVFCATAPSDASNLRRALEDRNPASLAMAAHTLKGSAGNFGAAPLCELCVQIEETALNGNFASAADLTARTEIELDRLVEALNAYRKAKLPL